MQKKLTITVDEKVYEGLHRFIGRRKISGFLENLARPYVVEGDLEKAYKKIAKDKNREAEASEWIEGVIGDAGYQKG